MGGFGSGRRSKWLTVEDSLELSVSLLNQESLLADGTHRKGSFAWPEEQEVSFEIDLRDPDEPWLRLAYSLTQESLDYRVGLESTSPHFGGLRWWFSCESCQRRSGKLYLPTGEKFFRCRRCHKLVYEAQRENRGSRLLRKAGKIRYRLGGSSNNPFPEKPKHMHWSTYNRLTLEVISAEKESLTAAVERFGP